MAEKIPESRLCREEPDPDNAGVGKGKLLPFSSLPEDML